MCIDKDIYLVMIGNMEVTGVLKGINDSFNLVLEDVTIKYMNQDSTVRSEIKKKGCFLNGHDIAYVFFGLM